MSSFYYKTIRLCLIIGCGVIFTIFDILNFVEIYQKWSVYNIWYVDFFGLWSYARFSLEKPLSEIYNNDILLDFQMDLGACPKCLLPYAYPPFFLLYILPLGFLSYHLAFLFWAFSTLVLYFVVSFNKRQRRYAAFLTIFAPATIIGFATRQTVILASALI